MKSLMNLVKFNYIEMLKALKSKIKIPTVSNKVLKRDKNICSMYHRLQSSYPDAHSKGCAEGSDPRGKRAKTTTFFPQQKK